MTFTLTTDTLPTDTSTTNGSVLRKARRFWWWVLGVSAAVSVLGNALHAWLRVDATHTPLANPKTGLALTMLPPIVAAGIAALIPIALLVHTHGLALLVQSPSKHGWLSRTVVLAVILGLGAGGFYLSFEALRELAMQAGFGSTEAWVFPLLVDGSIGGATFVLLSLPPIRATTAASQPAYTTETEQAHVDQSVTVTPATGESTSLMPGATAAPGERREPETPFAETTDDDDDRNDAALDAEVLTLDIPTHRTAAGQDQHTDCRSCTAVAERLCTGPNGNLDPAEVAQILHKVFDEGVEPGYVAAEFRWKERRLTRLIDDAGPHRLVALAG
ncbi:DUF2637 domain-containing protein [Nocardia puris]|uniref:DUF2637 domain-containing protein n=2 Tax=Nocardia TaxID=1817 RepID=UPI0018961D0B|nr:DUF2637 domain-containing protein [Nocardia puris]MBF6216125.1 DUF2637 domain-containing protein [Nocardia puris]